MADDISLTYRTNALKAQEKLKDAEAALREALSNLDVAVEYAIRAELRLMDTPQERIVMLGRIANANGATWSGGPSNASNIIEYVKRQHAVAELAKTRF